MPAGMHGQGGQRAIEFVAVGPQAAEQDVADDLAILLGDQFEHGVLVGAQAGDQGGFVAASEGGGQDGLDGGVVGGAGGADHPPRLQR